MLSAADNELLTRTGPGTPMGEYFRRYWLPVALSRELPEPDGPPIRVQDDGRGAGRVPRYRRARRPDRAALRASRRQPLLRPQRGRRPALRLPRLEVRRGRPVRRHADDAAREPATAARSPSRPIRRASSASWCGPTRARRARAASCPQLEFGVLPAVPPLRHQAAAAVQLGAGRARARSTPRISRSCTCRGSADAGSTPPCGRIVRRTRAHALAARRSAPAVHRHRARRGLRGRGRARKADGDELYWRVAQFMLPSHALAPARCRARSTRATPGCRSATSSAGSTPTRWHPERPITAEERARSGKGATATPSSGAATCRCATAPTTI